MQISGCPNSNHPNSNHPNSNHPDSNQVLLNQTGSIRSYTMRGFTLIEILVVLFIVSIMTGIAVVSLPGFTQTGEFDTEADRLKVVLEMLRDEALVQANEYGFKPETNGYQFFIYDDLQQNWVILEERPFTERDLQGKVRLSLTVEGDELNLGEEGEAPPVLILSSGEISSFELEIQSEIDHEVVRILECDGYGAISWRSTDES
jgi:general secretion pathway protein H